MNMKATRSNGWLWFTVPIASLLAVTAGGGLFVGGLYRDSRYFAAQAVGQDFVSLTAVLPTLIISALLASRGSRRSLLVWLGALVYLVYTYVIAAFAVRFNMLFLVYVALLGCSLYALIAGLLTVKMSGIKAGFMETTPVKTVSIYLTVLMALFYLIWLSEVVPALMAGQIPQSIQDNGTPSNPVHVLDMAWVLPAFGITAVSLWRKQALGYTLAGVVLTYLVLLPLAILSMAAFMIREGQPVVIPQLVIFGALFVVSLGILVWYLKSLGVYAALNSRPLPERNA